MNPTAGDLSERIKIETHRHSDLCKQNVENIYLPNQ